MTPDDLFACPALHQGPIIGTSQLENPSTVVWDSTDDVNAQANFSCRYHLPAAIPSRRPSIERRPGANYAGSGGDRHEIIHISMTKSRK